MKRVMLLLITLFAIASCGLHKGNHYGDATMIDGSWMGYPFKLTEVKSVINSSGLMEVQVSGKSKEKNHKTLEYQIKWLDRKGMMVHSDRANYWRQFPVFRKQDFSFVTVAPSSAAHRFKIYIRDPQENTYEVYDSEHVIQERY